MAKKALVIKNNKRMASSLSMKSKRDELRKSRNDKSLPLRDRLAIQAKINALPRDSAVSRVKNRCSITGRPRAYYRKFGISRIQLRVLANWGKLPGVVKSSW